MIIDLTINKQVAKSLSKLQHIGEIIEIKLPVKDGGRLEGTLPVIRVK
jgi:hypothetical protein